MFKKCLDYMQVR